MAYLIGLTGGIGSGKSTVASYFMENGIPVYIADQEAKRVMNSPQVIESLKETFGPTIYEGNTLKREKLAELVFNNPEKLKTLNEIVHPLVAEDFKHWVFAHQEEPLLVYESAILFETNSYKNFDCVITVTAPLAVRIERIIKRDNTERELILKKINSQFVDNQRISKSEFVIENINHEITKNRVVDIIKILRKRQNG